MLARCFRWLRHRYLGVSERTLMVLFQRATERIVDRRVEDELAAHAPYIQAKLDQAIRAVDLERSTREGLQQLVTEAIGRYGAGYVQERVRRALLAVVREAAQKVAYEAQRHLMQARLDEAVRAIDFKPRIEAAAQKTLTDALGRINFSGVGFEAFTLKVFRHLLSQRVGDGPRDPGPSD